MVKIENKTLIVYCFFNLLFMMSGVILVAIPVFGHQKVAAGPSIRSVAQALLLDECPLTAAMVNGIVVLCTFFVSIPSIILKKNRLFLTIQVCLVIFCAMFTLSVGLVIWYSTLQTKSNLAPLWDQSNSLVRSMLQWKFDCCGYNETRPFVQDDICPNAAVALTKGFCMVPYAAFANGFLDVIFTTMFGFCALDMVLLLSAMCVLKDRAEKARYALIDEKRNYSHYRYRKF